MNLKSETIKITIAIPVELKNSIPAEYSLTKFIVQAIREKLERDQRK
jgi:hypothetical protein